MLGLISDIVIATAEGIGGFIVGDATLNYLNRKEATGKATIGEAIADTTDKLKKGVAQLKRPKEIKTVEVASTT
jgi:hypothetical protein